jgi:hypothetical protein
MTRDEVGPIVLAAVSLAAEAIAKTTGASIPALTEDLRAIGDIPNFDSVLSEDVAGEIFEALGLPPELDENPFIDENRAATLGETIDKFLDLVNSRQKDK